VPKVSGRIGEYSHFSGDCQRRLLFGRTAAGGGSAARDGHAVLPLWARKGRAAFGYASEREASALTDDIARFWSKVKQSTLRARAIRLTIRHMIFAALVADRRLDRIQAAEHFRVCPIFDLWNLPRSYLGALLVGLLRESAPEDKSSANERESDDDQRVTQSLHFSTARTAS
jgi:hypothetical protein